MRKHDLGAARRFVKENDDWLPGYVLSLAAALEIVIGRMKETILTDHRNEPTCSRVECVGCLLQDWLLEMGVEEK